MTFCMIRAFSGGQKQGELAGQVPEVSELAVKILLLSASVLHFLSVESIVKAA